MYEETKVIENNYVNDFAFPEETIVIENNYVDEFAFPEDSIIYLSDCVPY